MDETDSLPSEWYVLKAAETVLFASLSYIMLLIQKGWSKKWVCWSSL